jgi:ATP-dependent DNA ligase
MAIGDEIASLAARAGFDPGRRTDRSRDGDRSLCPVERHRGPAIFGSSLRLSRVHWVRPELVVEVKFLAWTDQGMMRQVVYQDVREDKKARDVRR